MRESVLLLCFLLTLCSCRNHQEADLIIVGKIWTGNPEMKWAEAMAVQKDSIVAIGRLKDVENWIGPKTKKLETEKENLILPGFIDSHVHFIEGGFALSSVQLRDAKTPREFIQHIKDFADSLPDGAWITSGDWDHENWGGELPTRDWIDSVTARHPVWINRLDGHMCLANSAAMKIARITDKVKEIAGGTIVRDDKGKITGIFKDNAMELINKVVPLPGQVQEDKALDIAMKYVAARGVTSVHNMSGYIDVFERAHAKGTLITRIYAGMMLKDWIALNEKIKLEAGLGDKWLRVGSLKEFVDGSLGSHTAAFFKPFDDTPMDSGFFVTEEKLLYKRIKSADSLGFQVMVHAIGDRAIHTLLNIYDQVARENGQRDRRFRVEHAQHIHQSDLYRFGGQKVIASMQPYHAIDDGRWAEKIIGHPRARTTYAFRSLLDVNTTIAFGSDWFVAPPDPLQGIYAAVTRQTLDDANPGGWIPEQKITVEEAIRAYTYAGAYASFEEHIKGTLAPGMLADFVVLDKDITSIPPAEIRDVTVLMTVVGGKTVFKK